MSRRFWLAILALLALIFSLAPAAFPQMGSGMGSGMGMGNRLYDPTTELTVSGKVTAVETIAGNHGWDGLHLTLQAKSGDTYQVHLGPADYIHRKDFTFAEGDRVKVTGSSILYHGDRVIVARQITKGGKTLVLRDGQGHPYWAGRWQGRDN